MQESRKEVPIEAAEEVVLSVYGDVTLRGGAETPSLTIHGDPELVERADARQQGDRLELVFGRDWRERLSSGLKLLGNKPLHFDLALPDPRRVVLNGRGRLHVDGLHTKRFTVRINGLADAELRRLDLEELDVDVSGRGDVRATGRAARQDWRISGSARVRALELASEVARVRISGHGDVQLTVRDELEADVSGYGRVHYAGDPSVRQHVSGAGGVSRWEAPTPD